MYQRLFLECDQKVLKALPNDRWVKRSELYRAVRGWRYSFCRDVFQDVLNNLKAERMIITAKVTTRGRVCEVIAVGWCKVSPQGAAIGRPLPRQF